MPLPAEDKIIDDISARLKLLLTDLQINAAGENVLPVDSIFEYPRNQFDSLPAVTITPRAVPAEYATVAENERAYGFEVTCYHTLNEKNIGLSYQHMRWFVAAVMNKVDRSIDLQIPPTYPALVDFITPVTGDWFEEQTGGGIAIVAPVTVICRKSVQIKAM